MGDTRRGSRKSVIVVSSPPTSGPLANDFIDAAPPLISFESPAATTKFENRQTQRGGENEQSAEARGRPLVAAGESEQSRGVLLVSRAAGRPARDTAGELADANLPQVGLIDSRAINHSAHEASTREGPPLANGAHAHTHSAEAGECVCAGRTKQLEQSTPPGRSRV
ncbi:Hypothetical predicted protein [Olea europaea subsp. europaea]|uniref:Uncharacterized protein n=1 Tax=Olea europaea subsp. europaea TaxID=158383 RepID=A0A8S0TKD1_OLEEU|nr:Hypothetical predicted protein [Olea europaea subsp. europaea]